jgi:hypothetical protein
MMMSDNSLFIFKQAETSYFIDQVHSATATTLFTVALGGLVVSVLATGPKVRGFKPRPSTMDFKGDKIRSTPSFGGEVKR